MSRLKDSSRSPNLQSIPFHLTKSDQQQLPHQELVYKPKDQTMKSVKFAFIALAAICSTAIAAEDGASAAVVPEAQQHEETATRNLRSQPLNVIVEAENDIEQEVS